MIELNAWGQPVGPLVEPAWTARATPECRVLTGASVRLEPLADAHAPDLFRTLCGPEDASLWTYRPDGPPDTIAALERLNRATIGSPDKVTWAVIPAEVRHKAVSRRASGMVSLTAIERTHGRAEIAAVIFARGLQRSRASTEVHHLLIRYLIEDLGYRRVEWKCDTLNEPSRQAALRLGFRSEGTFAQHMVTRGRSRDTDYFALTDRDWLHVGPAQAAWLNPANFDEDGRQRSSLRELTGP